MKTIEVVAAIIFDEQGRIFATQRGYGEWKDWWNAVTLLEHEAAKWLKPEELNSVRWLPANEEIISHRNGLRHSR